MARFAVPLPNNGTSGPEGLTRLLGKLLSGSGVLGSGDLAVSAQTTPDMTVKVVPGDVAIYAGAIVYHGWSTANETVAIASNATGVTKTDVVVAYIDPTAASSTENNPNGLVLQSIRKPSGTGVPTNAEIVAIIGSKPYVILIEVTVGNGVTSINSGNIVDRRAQTRIPTAALEPDAVTKLLLDQTWDTINGVDRVIGAGGSGQWPGTTGVNFTTSGGLLEIVGTMTGLQLTSGTAYMGVVLDNTTASEFPNTTNFATIPEFSGRRFLTLPAGVHSIAPYGRSNGAGTLTWKAYNAVTVSVLEHKR